MTTTTIKNTPVPPSLLTLLLIFPFFFVLSSFSPARLSSPVNLGIVLVDRPDTAQMSDLCRHYGLTEAPAEDGFTVYTTPDGSKVRFKMVDKASSSGHIRQIPL